MISKLKGYAAVALLLAALGIGAWAYVQSLRINALSDDLDAARSSLTACEARQADILEHKGRTDEIDALPLDDLRDRASDWLLDF